MQAVLPQIFRTLTRPAKSGQAIILIAIGFVALIGFSGIATDTGLLYVRYTTLSRATDSAALAAAATLRQSTNYLSMVDTASHYLKLHGIDASSILVEDCATDIQNYETNNGITNPSSTDDQNAYNKLIVTPGELLCTRTASKLVRVSAQLEVQPSFLQLLGFHNIQLTASAISQAASLDAVVLLESSYNEAFDTRDGMTLQAQQGAGAAEYDKFTDFTSGTDNAGFTLAPYDETNPAGGVTTGGTNPHPNGSIRAECRWPVANYDTDPSNPGYYGPYQFDPTTHNILQDYTDPANPGTGANGPNYFYGNCCNAPINITNMPTGANSNNLISGSPIVINASGTLATTGLTYDGQDPELVGSISFSQIAKSSPRYTPSGYTPTRSTLPEVAANPTRNYANRNYVSLICEPFQQVRAGAFTFLENENFQAGDRAFMVTYDTTAHELTPNGDYADPTDFPSAKNTFPGLTNRNDAIDALYKYGGVEASPTGFHSGCPALKSTPPYNHNGWLTSAGSNQYTDLNANGSASGALLYETAATCVDSNTGGAILAGQSLLTNPAWIRRDAVWVMILMGAGYPNRTPGLNSGIAGQPHYNLATIATGSYANDVNNNYVTSTNFTAGTSPSEAFDKSAYPVSKNVWGSVESAQVTSQLDGGFCPWATFCSFTTAGDPPLPTNGACSPYCYTDQQTDAFPDGHAYDPSTGNKLAANLPNIAIPDAFDYNKANCTQEPNPIWWTDAQNGPQSQMFATHWNNPKSAFNYNDWQEFVSYRTDCVTPDPSARHFCLNPTTGVVNDPNAACDANYDAQDFARDMVDYAALDQWTSNQKGNFITMYSIFFPRQKSNYPQNTNPNQPDNGGTTGDIGANILGAVFLRYVADAGSTGSISNHVQQWYHNYWDVKAVSGGYANDATKTNPANIPPIAGHPAVGSGSKYALPGFDGTAGKGNPAYSSTTEDACAPYDFEENPGGAVNNARTQSAAIFGTIAGNAGPAPNSTAHLQSTNPQYQSLGIGYEDLYRYSCGNYYYASSSAEITKAFLSISNRLFVQISH